MDLRPSWKARLTVRFEDFGKALIAVPKSIPTINSQRGTTSRHPLTVVEEVDPDTGVKRFVLKSSPSSPSGPAAKQKASSDGFTFPIDNVIPRTFDLKLNGIRAPDTLSLTLKWIDFPFDPRLIRACGVEFFLGTLSPEDFAAGIGGDTRYSASSGSAPLNIIPDGYVEDGVDRTNLRFTGWADSYEMGWSESEPLVKIDCRDQTQLLLGQEAYPGGHLDDTLPLDKSIATYLANYPLFEGLSVEFRPAGSKAPIIKDVMSRSAYPVGGGPPVSKGGGGTEKLNVWDYLTDIVVAFGFIIRLDGLAIIIQPPRNLLGSKAAPRSDDPYKTRTVAGKTYPVRTFIYGENVSELHVTRKFARTSTNVEVRCYVPEQKRDLVARAPKGATVSAVGKATAPGAAPAPQIDARPGDGKSDQKWITRVVQGIKSQEQLQQLADSTYEMLNRYELSVHMKTRDFASFGGGDLDPDILDMKAGDAFEVRVKQGKDERSGSTIVDKEASLSVSGPSAQELISIGYNEDLAAAYDSAVTKADFQTGFLAREVNINGNVDNGVSLEVVGINFIEARVDVAPADPKYPQDAPK
jgi:hypothetical protein